MKFDEADGEESKKFQDEMKCLGSVSKLNGNSWVEIDKEVNVENVGLKRSVLPGLGKPIFVRYTEHISNNFSKNTPKGHKTEANGRIVLA